MYYARYKHRLNNLEIKEIRSNYKYKFQHFHSLHSWTNASHLGNPCYKFWEICFPSGKDERTLKKKNFVFDSVFVNVMSLNWLLFHQGALSQGSWRAWVRPTNSISGGTWGAMSVTPHWVAASLTGSAHTPLWSRLPRSQSLALNLQEAPHGLLASLSSLDKPVLHSPEWSSQGNSDWAMALFKNFQKFSRIEIKLSTIGPCLFLWFHLQLSFPHPTNLAFCCPSNMSASFPPQGLCTCWSPAWHTVLLMHGQPAHFRPPQRGHSTSHPSCTTAPASTAFSCYIFLPWTWHLVTYHTLFACLFVWFLIVSLSYRLQTPWWQALPIVFTAGSLVPGTRLMLCDYVLKERKEEGREGRRKKGFPFTPNVRATTLPPINNQQTFVVCGDPRGIRGSPSHCSAGVI